MSKETGGMYIPEDENGKEAMIKAIDHYLKPVIQDVERGEVFQKTPKKVKEKHASEE